MPFVLNVAVVTSEFGLANATVPGPLTTLQPVCRVEPGGKPSSVTWPFNVVTPGNPVMNRSGPAETTGGELVFSGDLPVLPELKRSKTSWAFNGRAYRLISSNRPLKTPGVPGTCAR